MKRNTSFRLSSLAAIVIINISPAAGETDPAGDAITIYSSAQPGAISPELYRSGGRGQPVPGYAVVRQQRQFNFTRGRNTVRFTDVAAYIDPTTVIFESMTDAAGTSVIEQDFQFDLVNQEKLLQRYVDQTIKIDQIRGNAVETFSGTLLSTTGGLTLKRGDGTLQLLPHNAGITLPSLPGGLITRPTLMWELNAKQSGSHMTRVSYQTAGMSWWADYNVTYADGNSANTCKLGIGAWVSIVNQSGASYAEAKLKLIAGDVQKVQRTGRVNEQAAAMKSRAADDRDAGFSEKSFFEYHLYTLGRSTALPDNSTKQIELFPMARNVPCEKTLVYYGLAPGYYGNAAHPVTDRNSGVQSNKKVDVYLGFSNTKPHQLGIPLPAGRVRVNKLDDADRTLELIGENVIDHTPANEKVLIKLGSAFDVVGERRQVDFKVDSSRKMLSEEIEIKLRNHKKEPVTVLIKENLYRWANWQITAKSHEYVKEDARTIQYPVKLAAGAEATVRYTVQYTW